jgi:single-stranded-DNA-specific exonuclease
MKEQRSLRGKIWQSADFLNDPELVQTRVFQERLGDEAELVWRQPEWSDLANPLELKDMGKAVSRIEKAIATKEKILVYGDFDADGITSTAALVHALKSLGALVSYRIPDRVNDSHGLKIELIEEIAATGTTLLITVDCGVNDYPEVEFANSVGIETIITDHHKVDPERWASNAFAVVNPMRPDCDFPHQNLAGVGVVFKLLQALKNDLQWLQPYSALVAIGSVADCVSLSSESRKLVQLGLVELNKNYWPGVHALLESDETITAETIGFQLAPCLNAASRLGQVQHAVQLFLGSDSGMSDRVEYLKHLNLERRELSQHYADQAKSLVQKDKAVQIIFLETCPVGVLGLVASRIVESVGQAVMVVTRHPHGALHGSARAPKNLNLAEALERVAPLLNAFGGHAGAAGFSLEENQFAEFLEAMQTWFARIETPPPELLIAAQADSAWLNLDWKAWEDTLEPFGIGNTKPIWQLNQLPLTELKVMGKTKQHLRLTFDGTHEVVAFFAEDLLPLLKTGNHYDLAVQVSKNTWRGDTKVQWQLVDVRG